MPRSRGSPRSTWLSVVVQVAYCPETPGLGRARQERGTETQHPKEEELCAACTGSSCGLGKLHPDDLTPELTVLTATTRTVSKQCLTANTCIPTWLSPPRR